MIFFSYFSLKKGNEFFSIMHEEANSMMMMVRPSTCLEFTRIRRDREHISGCAKQCGEED